MALTQLFDAIRDAWTGAGGVGFLDGEENLAAAGAPPRIVWGSTIETIGPPDPRWLGATPRALHLRRVTVDANLWGETRDDVEKLMASLVLAVRCAVGPSYALTGARWPQGPEKLVQRGVTCVLPITFFIPLVVPDGVEGEALVRSTDTTDTTTTDPLGG